MKYVLPFLILICLLVAGCAPPPPSLPVTFTGTGPMDTAPFTATADAWKIDWKYTAGESAVPTFGISVFPVGKNYFTDIIVGSDRSGSKTSQAGPGKYYLQVYSVNVTSWSITVSP
jgi:hypothetical protein